MLNAIDIFIVGRSDNLMVVCDFTYPGFGSHCCNESSKCPTQTSVHSCPFQKHFLVWWKLSLCMWLHWQYNDCWSPHLCAMYIPKPRPLMYPQTCSQGCWCPVLMAVNYVGLHGWSSYQIHALIFNHSTSPVSQYSGTTMYCLSLLNVFYLNCKFCLIQLCKHWDLDSLHHCNFLLRMTSGNNLKLW